MVGRRVSLWCQAVSGQGAPGGQGATVVLPMESTDAGKAILEHVLEGSPGFRALLDACLGPGSLSALQD